MADTLADIKESFWFAIGYSHCELRFWEELSFGIAWSSEESSKKTFVIGFVSSKVELKPGKYGFGLFVKSDVKKDEVLLDIPHESAFRYP